MRKFEHMNGNEILMQWLPPEPVFVTEVGGTVTITLPPAVEGRTFTINQPPAGQTIVIRRSDSEEISMVDPDVPILQDVTFNFDPWRDRA